MPARRNRPQRVKRANPASVPTPLTGKRVLINTFLIFHLVAIACWCLPLSTPLTLAARDFVRPYFLWTGLFQSWDMFSPSPKSVNNYLEAIVLYNDGDTRVWKFPRMDQLSLTERYFKERYRKYAENLNDERFSALWPDAARHIARLNNDRPAGVRTVFLVRYWSDIAPPTAAPDRASPENEHVFYSYSVLPEDLH